MRELKTHLRPDARRHRKAFGPQFWQAVRERRKLQTLRTEGATRINAGDVLVAFRWTGRPYRSKQEVIGEFVIDSVAPVTIGPDSVRLAPADFNPPEVITAPEELEKFAVADGFEKWADFAAYFNLTRQGEPGVTRETGHNFRGLLIKWL